MKEQSPHLSLDELHGLFAQLNPLDVEQFYTAYQFWSTRQRIQTLQAQIDDIQCDIEENTERLEQVHPSALALATLARLQANGVSDVVVLDRMLERGEEWLDRTMQRLEYCEKLDVISGDYTKWCEHALEGAYDWIDSVLGQEAVDASSIKPTFFETPVKEYHESVEQQETHENSEMMEELFLQKLMSDELEDAEAAEDEASLLETTLKIAALSQPKKQEILPDANNAQPAQSELNMPPAEQETRPEVVESTPVLAETQAEHTEVTKMAVEEQEAQQPVQQPIEVAHESIEHSDKVMVTPQEAAISNRSQMASSPEGEADVAEATNNEIAPSTSTEVKQNKGLWRTVIAVLFHV